MTRLTKFLSILSVLLAITGCSTVDIREKPFEVWVTDDTKISAEPLTEALFAKKGTVKQSVTGNWKGNAFSAECVQKCTEGEYVAVFLAPHMRLVTIRVTPPHTVKCDRSAQIPDAFLPEYALFDLAVVNLDTETLAKVLGREVSVEESDSKRTLSVAGKVIAVITKISSDETHYENTVRGYTYTLKDIR